MTLPRTRISLACLIAGAAVVSTGVAQESDPPSSANPDDRQTPAMTADTGEARAIATRQKSFNFKRQELNQQLTITEIEARLAEANARIAEAKNRANPKQDDDESEAEPKDILEQIDPQSLRVKLGLPPTGPIVPKVEEKPAKRPAPAPVDPSQTVVPRLIGMAAGKATFDLRGRLVEVRPGQAINQRFDLASLDPSSATIVEKGTGTKQQLMIQWKDKDMDDDESGPARAVAGQRFGAGPGR